MTECTNWITRENLKRQMDEKHLYGTLDFTFFRSYDSMVFFLETWGDNKNLLAITILHRLLGQNHHLPGTALEYFVNHTPLVYLHFIANILHSITKVLKNQKYLKIQCFMGFLNDSWTGAIWKKTPIIKYIVVDYQGRNTLNLLNKYFMRYLYFSTSMNLSYRYHYRN